MCQYGHSIDFHATQCGHLTYKQGRIRSGLTHRAHPPLCMLMHACVLGGGGGGEAGESSSLCGFEAGTRVWAPLLAAAADDAAPAGAGGGEWLPRLLAASCLFRGEA